MPNGDVLFPEDVPRQFHRHVNKVVQEEYMGEECAERLWGKTPFGQYFVLITTEVLWYAVRLIADEENRDLDIVRQRDVNNSYILEKSQHLTPEGAHGYRVQTHQKLSNGIFPDHVPHRIRKLPPDCIYNPDFYLKPGDHIQRNLGATISIGNHEGIYLGSGKVAHISTEKSTVNSVTAISEKSVACARISNIEDFVNCPDQKIRVVVHCLRRRSREDICETAHRLVKQRYREGEYHLFQRNCQHFASHCAIGMEWMSDKDDLIEKGIIWGAGIFAVGAAIHMFLNKNESEDPEQKRENQRASTSRR